MQLKQTKTQSHIYDLKIELIDNTQSIQYKHKITNTHNKQHTVVY